jgi:hypothetical protein
MIDYERGEGPDDWEARARVQGSRHMLAIDECKHLLPEFLCRVCTPVAPRETMERRPTRRFVPRYRPRIADAEDTDAGSDQQLPAAQFRRP